MLAICVIDLTRENRRKKMEHRRRGDGETTRQTTRTWTLELTLSVAVRTFVLQVYGSYALPRPVV
jgi:hypothetical protein